MFDAFDALSLKDLFEVYHGILAYWNKESVVASRLSGNLSRVATSFARKYKETEAKESLLSYMNSRTLSYGNKGKEAGEAFLRRAYQQQSNRMAG